MSAVTSDGVKKDQKIYGNYQVLSSDGILIFRCDNKILQSSNQRKN